MHKLARTGLSLLGGVIGIGLAAAAGQAGHHPVPVAVLKTAVAAGQPIPASAVATVRVPAGAAQHWLPPAAVIGRTAGLPLPAGTPVVAADVTGSGLRLPPGWAAVTLALSAAQAGPVTVGDRVAVLSGGSGSGTGQVLLTGIRVLRVTGFAGGGSLLGGSSQQGLVTLEVPQTALPWFGGTPQLTLAVEPAGTPPALVTPPLGGKAGG
ncbi:Flagellar hook-associated protein flgK [Candidatus Hydrogenisulfobacillus filiaventi]|uniref:Flagellar hook-associated protein flgK n=1 Tax=Candidatus Hydrogenisulfobacillus filiaventi TaxID=2707344 RepID=A0A6F8ZI09_9FIRM|nr:Flagellar hook-associated protein flgK [Candidatus Hydrogenisulfobacillus filiaventi]